MNLLSKYSGIIALILGVVVLITIAAGLFLESIIVSIIGFIFAVIALIALKQKQGNRIITITAFILNSLLLIYLGLIWCIA